tara:strand:+ start:1278 stop:1628 length:351 start_codon:yes stop_codon:yes gene_type:complete
MKNKLLLLILIFAIKLSFSQDNKYLIAEINTEIFCNHCLECESCDDNIFSKIKENNNGVSYVKIDSKKNIIKVKYNSEKTNLKEIEKAIALSGYKANELEPINKAYESLDYCCKKK